MRAFVLVAVLTLAPAADASCELSSARISGSLVKVGDSERKVLNQDPDRVVQLENRRGGAAGIRYDFHLRGKTVQVYVRAGRISRICHIRD